MKVSFMIVIVTLITIKVRSFRFQIIIGGIFWTFIIILRLQIYIHGLFRDFDFFWCRKHITLLENWNKLPIILPLYITCYIRSSVHTIHAIYQTYTM